MKRHLTPSPALLVALGVFLGFRARVLHVAFDAVSIPAFELAVMGNLAYLGASAESGAPLALYYDNCGGQVLTGLLAAPLYALLGPSYLALKLVPLALGLAVLLLLWRMLAAHYDRRAADLFALLFALGPPTLAKYSLLAKGNHFEGLFFQVLLLVSFVGMHARGTSVGGLVRTGALGGFALFAYFGSVVSLLVLGSLHLYVRGKRALADLGPALLGFALGLSPLAYFELRAAWRPSRFLLAKLEGALPGFAERLEHLLGVVLPRAGAFEDLGGIDARSADLAFLAAFAWAALVILAGALRGVLRARREPAMTVERARFEAVAALPFFLHLPILLLCVAAARFELRPYAPPVEVGGYRYLVSSLAFALVAIALAAARLARAPRRATRITGGTLAALALATGAFSLPIARPSARESGLGARYPGHHFLQYANVLLRDRERAQDGEFRWSVSRLERNLAGLAPAQRREAWTGVGHFAAWAQRLGGGRLREPMTRSLSLERLLEPYPIDARAAIARGAGSYLRRILRDEGDAKELARQLTTLAGEAHPLLPLLVEGLCLDERFPTLLAAPALVATSEAAGACVPAELRPAWRRGLGVQVGRMAARGLATDARRVHQLAARVPSAERGPFWSGVGAGFAEGAPAREARARLLELTPERRREQALAGFSEASGSAPR